MKKRKAPFRGEATLTERRQQQAFDALMRAEDNLSRALARWKNARKKFHAYLRRADKKLAADADWRDIATSAEKIREPDPDDSDRLQSP